MIRYSTLVGVRRQNHHWVTRIISFCINETEDKTYFFTESNSGRVNSADSLEELEQKRRMLLSTGFFECASVKA